MMNSGAYVRRPLICEHLGIGTAPLRDGPDVSWIPRCRLGDNQRSNPACVMFAWASWAEIMFGARISDAECVDAWKQARYKIYGGDLSGGLYLDEGHAMAQEMGWIPKSHRYKAVDDIQMLSQQPIVSAFKVTAGWDFAAHCEGEVRVNPADPTRGLHAVVIVAHGDVKAFGSERFTYIENSWGRSWGWNGLGVFSAGSYSASICDLAVSLDQAAEGGSAT